MLTLHYKPGSCSFAAHIVLEEIGEPYALRPVDLAAGEQRTEAFLKINPQGRVPVLTLDDGEPLGWAAWKAITVGSGSSCRWPAGRWSSWAPTRETGRPGAQLWETPSA